MAEHHWHGSGLIINPIVSSLKMDELIREKWRKQLQDGYPTCRPALSTGLCAHPGCQLNGFDLTLGLCPCHYVTDVLGAIEDAYHDANERWIASVHAESNAKHIWRCRCGFVGKYETLNEHLVANAGSEDHGPYESHRVVGQTRLQMGVQESGDLKKGRQRLTPRTNISNIEEIG